MKSSLYVLAVENSLLFVLRYLDLIGFADDLVVLNNFVLGEAAKSFLSLEKHLSLKHLVELRRVSFVSTDEVRFLALKRGTFLLLPP